MLPLDLKLIQLMHQIVNNDRAARYGREIADMVKDADFDGRAALAAPSQPAPASRLGLRTLVGRLVRRPIVEA